MAPLDIHLTETIIRFSRRQLWGVLGIMFALAASYPIRMFYPDHANGMAALYIMFVVAFAGWSSRIKWNTRETREAISAVENDELRKLAYTKAFRNGFFVQLVYPAASAFALLGFGMADPWPLVVGSSAWLGFVTFLVSVLWYDR